jgi:hypothetical protein
MSLFDLLPNELAAEIFLQLSSCEGVGYILAAVCRSWRDVSYSVPQLWTRINIRKWSNPSLSLQEARNGLKAEIERSGTLLPLDINWNFTRNSNFAHERLSEILLSSASMSRWQTLEITGHSAGAKLLSMEENRDLSKLEVLKFRGFLPPNPEFPLDEMTQVQSLYLYGCAWEPFYSRFPDFCRRIKILSTREIYLRGSILPPTLEKVTLFGITQPYSQHGLMALSNTKHVIIEGPFYLPPTMMLDNLEVLEVAGVVHNVFSRPKEGFAGQLRLPKLRRLSIHLDRYERDDLESSLPLEQKLLAAGEVNNIKSEV